MEDGDSSRVTNARLDERIRHLTELFQDYCRRSLEEQREIKDQLKDMNGSVRANRESVIDHGGRIEVLEEWKDKLIRTFIESLARGLGTGMGAAIVIGGIVFGIGKAAGWW